VIQNGELIVPTRPGWGADINEEAVRAHPPKNPIREGNVIWSTNCAATRSFPARCRNT
jgi:hypothetical protein